ncbi:sushi, nidogen and EGF-like domain-containing protein 1 [Cyprinus carpio]|uniref:Sushi, nidogen and EGF-like domain-containing protein 1 n=1 Tax=Cyprinus carpio TaxID=7962 RepID=A0A9Q9YPK0_CYPCA|nr:sushi, nidogen and EGF-like domain-containing protein 1 [Cyprinus carpio]
MRILPVSEHLLLLIMMSVLSSSLAQTTAVPQTNVRLVNGFSFCSGRLEILHNGIWGTVCDDQWDSLNAAVVCRQLDCGNVVESLHVFGQGSGQIWLDEVQCIGIETALQNCASSAWGVHDCGHHEDVGLLCEEVFYPFGLAAGDTNNSASLDGSSSVIQLLSPFLFFGRTYQQIYVNNNGHLTFNQPSVQNVPDHFPSYGSQDIIAGLWTNLDNRQRGVVSYHQYTSGNVLTRATQDINTHFPNLTFTASWVFVATWDKVVYFNTSSETLFQVVLISGSNFSFILMNYGNVAVTGHPVQAGYDAVYSADYFVIPGSNKGNLIPNLRSSSNVNFPGRWAFRVDSGPKSKKDTGNIQIILQRIKQELVKYGLPNSVELKLRKLQRTKP